ncbi:Spy/CpxP family protein refolding chaperone [Aquabacterium sp.]|uniref:Spy/CpxP family protein refolding chaperone n=1 Tax=Aquabacterium sp. TaxID=1872578 RepID=UPI002C57F8ED|nr:Spy/CpxP family protein refolding chaperone [Aquabacterium sp.]HSW08255.1 Spy/CpxP family protein refolding chaperone [Aquabacterium sp.]
MRRWLKRTLIGLFGATLLVGGGLAACSHHRYGHGSWPMSEADAAKLRERVIDKASRELQLDDAQRTRLGVLADAVKAQRNALVAGTPNPRADLQALVAGAQFDRAKAQALIEGKTSAVREHSPVLVTAFGDFYDSLRPEQQQKLREFMARGRHGRHGHWQG